VALTAEEHEPRKRRANGERSRQAILDAAAEIAGERGYDGTSIALVSERSGLPASSIYWHYEDKDALIAAAIERSFGEWLDGASVLPPPAAGSTRWDRLGALAERTAKGVKTSRSFLRLGLLLSLERREEEPSARRMFLQVREEAFRRMITAFTELFPELDEVAIAQLVTFSIAIADGLFISNELGNEAFDMLEQREVVVAAVFGAAKCLSDQRSARTDGEVRGRIEIDGEARLSPPPSPQGGTGADGRTI
jgi:AcrR family transcriptional regulator